MNEKKKIHLGKVESVGCFWYLDLYFNDKKFKNTLEFSFFNDKNNY